MKNIDAVQHKIIAFSDVEAWVNAKKIKGKTIAFTNGCFDILHEGHIYSLSQAAKEADILVAGVNADLSVKKLKGENRPVNNEYSRSLIIASLLIVDAVVIFKEDTPLQLIKKIMPDVLVKGGDYTIETIVGAQEVIANKGRVVINPIIQNLSSTGLIQKIQSL